MTERRRRWAEVGLVLAGLLLLAVGRWALEVSGQRAFTAEDIPVLNLPIRAYYGEWLRRGVLVMWTADLQRGFPTFAESQAGWTYPAKALYFLPLAPWTLLAWTIVAHLAWAGTGLYAYLRAIDVRRAAAILPAIGFGLGAHLVVRHQHTNVLEALSWWPWLLLGVELHLRRHDHWTVLGLGVAGGLMAMCGHVQFVVYGATLAGIYALFRLVSERPADGWHKLAGLAVAAVIMGGLATAQYLPLLELTRFSTRAHGVDADNWLVQLSPMHFPLFVAPSTYGPMFDLNFSHPALRWEATGYIGVLTLILAGIGAGRRDRLARFWLVLGVLALIAAAGAPLKLYLLLSTVFRWGSFRVPSRLISWYVLAASVLAGVGAEELYAGRWRSSARTATALGVATAAIMIGAFAAPRLLERAGLGAGTYPRASLALCGLLVVAASEWLAATVAAVAGGEATARSRRRWVRLAVGLMLVDVLCTSRYLTPSQPSDVYRHVPSPPGGRVAVGTDVVRNIPWYRPDTNLLCGAPNVFNMSPLSLQGPVVLYEQARGREDGVFRLMRLWGVSGYDRGDGWPAPAPLTPMPLAWPVRHIEQVPIRRDLVDGLVDDDFRPDVVAWRWTPRGADNLPDSTWSTPPAVRVLPQHSTNRWTCEVRGHGEGWVVLNFTPYPALRVSAAGRRLPAIVVNECQLAVRCPVDQTSLVRLVFESTSVKLGRFVTLLTLALIAGVVGAGWKKTR